MKYFINFIVTNYYKYNPIEVNKDIIRIKFTI